MACVHVAARYRILILDLDIPEGASGDPALAVELETKETDMTKIVSEIRKRRLPAGILVIGLLAATAGQAWAAPSYQTTLAGPSAGRSFQTSRGGSAFITGNVGSMETTTLPGSAGQGLLMNNGNGTSTLLTPGGVPQVVATPR